MTWKLWLVAAFRLASESWRRVIEIIEAHVAALIDKLNAEDERLSAEERNNRWVPDAFATPSNRLPTAAYGTSGYYQFCAKF
jgi:hypothetical protein